VHESWEGINFWRQDCNKFFKIFKDVLKGKFKNSYRGSCVSEKRPPVD